MNDILFLSTYISTVLYVQTFFLDTDKQQETIRSNSGSLIPLPFLSLILLLLKF